METGRIPRNKQISVEFLRKYTVLPANEMIKDRCARSFIDAVESLYPASESLNTQSATFEMIDLLKDFMQHEERVTQADLWEYFLHRYRGVKISSLVENAIVNHRVWIADNSDKETREPKIVYNIVSEDIEPRGWTGYRHDRVTKKDDYRATPRETHAAFLRAFIHFGDRKLEPENRRRLSAAVEYLHPTQKEVDEHRAAVRCYSTDAERLLAAAGVDALRGILPSTLIPMIKDQGVDLTHARIANAAIDACGSDALKRCRGALDHLGPPPQWAGSKQAVDFVRSLGFSDEWAGERNKGTSPFLDVEGPSVLPELHDFQKTIVSNVRDMLRRGDVDGAERRGMISMPTGSGKTRVAVQAVVEAMRDDGLDGDILWVADREELCEQAVEAWRQVWSSIGRQAARLRISRMWGGQPWPQPTDDPHVVVATIQTLYAKFADSTGNSELPADLKVVVFDEAHRSIARTFTSVMEDIGLTRWRRPQEPLLLGLTATPYRGHDAEETARLVRRYGGNRLHAGAFASDDSQDVIDDLQEMQVLARADHETIDGGVFFLDNNEKTQAESAPWLPRSVEDRIARDSYRTQRIIEAYEQHVKSKWPTLVFATSVEHAQTVAALLNARGVRSRAVSGTTERATRRRVVEGFRQGEIKALVNYGVLREGFDAPRTRAIIIARPVYSPNLYFQMIGRGLRGVKNGGNDRCLILNVQDNIENFQQELAFSDLDWLWDQGKT